MGRVEEEVFRLKYETLGERELEKLRAEITATEKHLRGKAEQLKQGAIGMDAYSDAVKKAARELAPLKAELAGYERAAAKAAAAAKASADATEDASAKAKSSAAGFGNAGNAVFQMANLMEDAQFGARGLANNIGMLASTMFNFHPVAMAVGGVLQVLTAVFRDQIDAMLAQAGILDENLVKGMNNAKEATEDFAASQEKLLASMPNVTVQIKEQVAAIGEMTKKLEGTQAKRLMEQAALEETGYRTKDLAQAQKELSAAQAEMNRIAAQGPAADPGGRRMALAVRQRDQAQQQIEGIAADRQRFAEDRVARQTARAGSSEEGALEQAARLRNLSDRTGNQDLADLAGAIERLTQTYKDAEADAGGMGVRTRERQQREAADRALVDALLQQGDDNREATDRLTEQQRQAADAAREAAQQAMADPVVAGAGAGMLQDLMAGKDPAAAADELMQQLRQLGYTIEEAFSTAARVTAEVNQRAQQQIRAEALRNFRQMQGFNPFLNNRPDGL